MIHMISFSVTNMRQCRQLSSDGDRSYIFEPSLRVFAILLFILCVVVKEANSYGFQLTAGGTSERNDSGTV